MLTASLRRGRLVMFAVLALLAYCASGTAWAQTAVPNFSFAHTSDDHNMAGAGQTISEFVTPAPIKLAPYNVTADPISFVIDTGDMTEFGPGEGRLTTFRGFYKSVAIPLYASLGNHDGTWRSLTYELRQQYGSPYYSFDKYGCHFVILDSAGLQDPRPTIPPEQLAWLAQDLAGVGNDKPVFIALHHPLDVTEFASKYEVERLMDLIRPYNVVMIMVGHGHSATHKVFSGVDMVQGGSTYGPGPAGYQVVSVQDGMLRVAYKKRGELEATKAMLEKPITPPTKRYPAITIASPKERSTLNGAIPIKVWVSLGPGEVKSATADIDGSAKTDLAPKPGGSLEGTAPITDLLPGAHYMTVTITAQDGTTYSHSTNFYLASTKPKVLWRAFMGTASKTTPSVGNQYVYVGGYDGSVRAYDRKTGLPKWMYQTNGAVAGQVLLLGDKVYVGSEDKNLYCLSAEKGTKIWKFEAEDPIYSSPVSDGKSVYFGCGTGAFYSVNAKTGKQVWKNSDATYNIELKPFLANGRVYYGAWDSHLYCVNTTDGKLVWKCMTKGSSEGAAPNYYSPADCGPVVCQGKVFAADRKFRCSILDDATGKLTNYIDNVSAVALSGDGNSVYLRMLDKKAQKVDSSGTAIWTVDVPSDEVPAAPREVGGTVYICSKRGTLSALDAKDGKILSQYAVTPQMYVLACVNGAGTTAYAAGTDGSLTAFGY